MGLSELDSAGPKSGMDPSWFLCSDLTAQGPRERHFWSEGLELTMHCAHPFRVALERARDEASTATGGTLPLDMVGSSEVHVVVATSDKASALAITAFFKKCYVYTTVQALVDDIRLSGSASLGILFLDRSWYADRELRRFIGPMNVRNIWLMYSSLEIMSDDLRQQMQEHEDDAHNVRFVHRPPSHEVLKAVLAGVSDAPTTAGPALSAREQLNR